MRSARFVLLVVLATGVAGCGGDDGTSGGAQTPAASEQDAGQQNGGSVEAAVMPGGVRADVAVSPCELFTDDEAMMLADAEPVFERMEDDVHFGLVGCDIEVGGVSLAIGAFAVGDWVDRLLDLWQFRSVAGDDDPAFAALEPLIPLIEAGERFEGDAGCAVFDLVQRGSLVEEPMLRVNGLPTPERPLDVDARSCRDGVVVIVSVTSSRFWGSEDGLDRLRSAVDAVHATARSG